MSEETTGPIEHVVIVGGGTAGWLTANYLRRALKQATRITLVESDEVDRIGVGEATFQTLKRTLEYIGLQESDWMPHCGATYKYGIDFINWREPASDGVDSSYFHPFFRTDRFEVQRNINPYDRAYGHWIGGNGFSIYHYWLEEQRRGSAASFAEALCPCTTAARGSLAPHAVDGSFSLPYGYHLDALALSNFLRRYGKRNGVEHVVGHVTRVAKDDHNNIVAVETNDTRVAGDLFIDCTGFRSLLIGDALGEPFLSDADALFCDRAVAIQARRDRGPSIRPYTKATAVDAGWIWDVPLYHRSGVGYVYASRFCDEERAEQLLRTYLGDRADELPARHLAFRVGRRRRMWVNNCLAIGLSGCFIEPLESTGIMLIEHALAALVDVFPDRRFPEVFRRHYNQHMDETYLGLRDFIVLHYILSDRTDSEFWRAVANETTVSPALRQFVEFSRESLFSRTSPLGPLFGDRSYVCVLDGMGATPSRGLPMLEQAPQVDVRSVLDEIECDVRALISQLPDHAEYLDQLHGPPTRDSDIAV